MGRPFRISTYCALGLCGTHVLCKCSLNSDIICSAGLAWCCKDMISQVLNDRMALRSEVSKNAELVEISFKKKIKE